MTDSCKDRIEARAQQIHSWRHRAGTAGVCGGCRDLAAAEHCASHSDVSVAGSQDAADSPSRPEAG